MKTIQASTLLLAALLLPAALPGQEIPLQQFSSSTPQIDLRVYVDISVEFWIQGGRIRYNAGGTRAPRNDGSAYSAALPSFAVSDLKVKKMDGRGDIIVLEQPTQRNAWTLKLRISDPKGGEDRYHARITWDDGRRAPSTPSYPTAPYVEISEMSATAAGSGQVRVGGQRLGLSGTSVSLTPSGRAIVSFQGDSAPRFRGTWKQSGNRIELTLDEALGAAGSAANGSIRLSGDRLRSIDIEGTAAGQGAFNLAFNQRGDYKDFTKPAGATAPKAPTAPVVRSPSTPIGGGKVTTGKVNSAKVNSGIVSPTPPGSVRSRRPTSPPTSSVSSSIQNLSQRLKGDGYLESAGRGDEEDVIKEVLVRLDQGGKARFELDGERYWSAEGTWRQLSGDRVEITMQQFNSAPALGRATLTMQPATRSTPSLVRQVEMTITASRIGALDIRFRAN